jgi:hypothetical protein
MHNNTYTVVGTSVLNGALKIRFANGLAKRERVLARNGHIDIMLLETTEMHKIDIAKFALTQADFFNEEQLAVIREYVKQNSVAE